MKQFLLYILFFVCVVGCSVGIETIEPIEAGEDVAAIDTMSMLKTRGLSSPKGNFVFRNSGSIVHLPGFQSGGVLWTDREYEFVYDPTETPPTNYSDWTFYESTLYVDGAEISNSNWNTSFALSHIFTNPGRYTAIGNTVWESPADYYYNKDTRQYEPRYGEHRDEESFTVVKHSVYSLTISGSDMPGTGHQTTYSVPSNLPYDVAFTGWSVSPGIGWTAANLSATTLNISFTTEMSYYLTATLRLATGKLVSITKTVDLSPPANFTVTGPTGKPKANGLGRDRHNPSSDLHRLDRRPDRDLTPAVLFCVCTCINRQFYYL